MMTSLPRSVETEAPDTLRLMKFGFSHAINTCKLQYCRQHKDQDDRTSMILQHIGSPEVLMEKSIYEDVC